MQQPSAPNELSSRGALPCAWTAWGCVLSICSSKASSEASRIGLPGEGARRARATRTLGSPCAGSGRAALIRMPGIRV